MSHLIFVVDGLPEGIADFRRTLDRHSFGKGVCRLREVRLFDLQYDSRDEKAIMEEFKFNLNGRNYKDRAAYKFINKHLPFKHGKFKTIVNLFVKMFGWIIELKPFEPWKEKNLKPRSEIPKGTVNIFPIGKVNDVSVFVKPYGKVEEYL